MDKLTLSNSEYNFIKRNKKLNIKDIFTDKFKNLLKEEIFDNIELKDISPDVVFNSFDKGRIMSSILNKLNK